MLVIRLQRTGRENTPTYRVVLSEKARHAKKGAQEILGHFIPTGSKPVFEVKRDRIAHWISKGAKPSNTLARLLKKGGMDGMDSFILRYVKKVSRNQEAAADNQTPAAAPATTQEAATA